MNQPVYQNDEILEETIFHGATARRRAASQISTCSKLIYALISLGCDLDSTRLPGKQCLQLELIIPSLTILFPMKTSLKRKQEKKVIKKYRYYNREICFNKVKGKKDRIVQGRGTPSEIFCLYGVRCTCTTFETYEWSRSQGRHPILAWRVSNPDLGRTCGQTCERISSALPPSLLVFSTLCTLPYLNIHPRSCPASWISTITLSPHFCHLFERKRNKS